ncbi:MAG: V-type ATP synthase subunit E [Methanosarcinales archaeon]
MSLESVSEDILAKSKSKVKEIESETEEEINKILKEAKDQAAKIKVAKEEEAKKNIIVRRQRELASVSLEVKRAELNVKKEVLDLTKQAVINKISELQNSKKEALLKSLIQANQHKGSRIFSNKKDENLVKKYAGNNLKYAGNINCIGGIVIEDDSGKIKHDLTFDNIINDVFEKSLKHVSEILFKN